MDKLNKIITLAMIGLFASFSFLVSAAFCVGQIEVQFVPTQTYPTVLKNMKVQTDVVVNQTAVAIIVVDRDNPFYDALANNINASIATLPGLSSVALTKMDDDIFLSTPTFVNPIILIGNYATNKVIKQYVYEQSRQLVDINRPGANNWVINNVRIGREANGQYAANNAIVIASQSDTQLQAAVDYFRNTLLSSAYQNNSIVFNESISSERSTRWSITPGYTTPNPASSTLTTTDLGTAFDNANQYWLTGNTAYANNFVKILNNYGAVVENPDYFDDVGPQLNAIVGDNSGAVDFHYYKLMAAWRNVQRSPYFSDSSLPLHPVHNIDQRLYIDKLLNYIMREYYKTGGVRGYFSATGVYGAIGYAELHNFPIPNHELSAAVGVFIGGQYFTQDGYSYDVTNVQNYSYDPEYPNDHAASWVSDGDIAFAPYLGLSYSNDDAGGYWQADTGYTRDYLRFKGDAQVTQAYFGNSGGSLGVGIDKSAAETFCIVTPNSLLKPGFGDTHELSGPDWETYALREWRERYSNGRYSWMCDDLYNVGMLGSTDWGKSFLQYGLVDIEELGIQNQMPTDLLGIKAIPLQQNLYNIANNMGGERTFGNNIIYDEPYKEAHVDLADATNKVVLRSGWGNGLQEEDQYIGIDCVSYLFHGHEDALGIFGFEDNGSLFLIDNTYHYRDRGYQNAVTVTKTDYPVESERNAESNSSTVARVNTISEVGNLGFFDLELPFYGNFTDWSEEPITGEEWSVDLFRAGIWNRENFILIMDEMEANDAGVYDMYIRWKPNVEDPAYSYTVDGNTIDIVNTQDREHCKLVASDSIYETDPVYGNLRNLSSGHILQAQDITSAATLIYTFNETTNLDPIYVLSRAGDRIFKVEATAGNTSGIVDERIYMGKADNGIPVSFGDESITVVADMFYVVTSEPELGDPPLIFQTKYFALAGGSFLRQDSGAQLYFESIDGDIANPTFIPIDIEFNVAELQATIDLDLEGSQVAHISLYATSEDLIVRIKESGTEDWETIESEWGGKNTITFVMDESGEFDVKLVGPGPDIADIEDEIVYIGGESLIIDISADDPNSVVIEFLAFGDPLDNGAILSIIGDKEARLTWDPIEGNIGSHNVLIVAQDESGNTDSKLFKINVYPSGYAPSGSNVANLDPNASYDVTVNENTVSSNGNLTDGNLATYEQFSSPGDWDLTVTLDLGAQYSLSDVKVVTRGEYPEPIGYGGLIHPDHIDVFAPASEANPTITINCTPANGWTELQSIGEFTQAIDASDIKFKLHYVRPQNYGGYSTFGRVMEIEVYNVSNEPALVEVSPNGLISLNVGEKAIVELSAQDPESGSVDFEYYGAPIGKMQLRDLGNNSALCRLTAGPGMAGSFNDVVICAFDEADNITTIPIVSYVLRNMTQGNIKITNPKPNRNKK